MPLPETIEKALARWIDEGLTGMGEVAVTPAPAGTGYLLSHRDDVQQSLAAPEQFETFVRPEDARTIALWDTHGEYRPLKTAPTLRRGWLLRLPDAAALREALDYFYPAMAGTWLHVQRGDGVPVPLRETLERQTGMYRFARRITDDDACAIAARLCRSETGCLKKILWKISENADLAGLPAAKFDPGAAPDGLADGRIPMPCTEACTFIVSEARRVAGEAFARKSTDG